ncbi:rhodanese-like domain-containing protein [Jannaschia rubra]|uniref:Putative adenylyltransferase/sulfurtransferase MoeZ n=1 Tax=Jannaschia rubra TaxID=282197 RepID=A0A0M6XLX2_9RHOB|nr:rhodanese-like domain-containing protein [Jannaschia rubra]CTQ32190.1 putative adenylyltransferase/sulfurtransferase MoeZ [Jannaschia rubra]SFG35490.1 Rhodanese-related sulfurtransferase [Jannaschia rubra]
MNRDQTEDGTIVTMTPQEVSDAIDRREIVLIDVRTPQEFSFERIPAALLSPMQSFDPAYLPGQADKRIVLHCGSAVRSGKVAEQCLKAGFDEIAHMEGGLAAWKEAGLEYTGTDMGTGAPKAMRKE